MDKKTARELGKLLRIRREALHLSTRALGAQIGVDDSTIVRIEQGARSTPRPDVLAKLAQALQISLADIYALVGYAIPHDLPSLPAYLKLKYRDLPPAAQEELIGYIDYLQKRYGFENDGPLPGEDE